MDFGLNQNKIEVKDIPKGTSIIAQEFRPGKPDPTPIEVIQQQTIEMTQQMLEFQEGESDSAGGVQAQRGTQRGGQTTSTAAKESASAPSQSDSEKVKSEEPVRKERIKQRIRNHFDQWMDENSFDANRFEQELIYYFEKLDVTEELVRLETHLDYFMKSLKDENAQGKKLGFISQEIGREINTIGSKANDAEIQKHVILMKDELEKIKEQTLNVL